MDELLASTFNVSPGQPVGANTGYLLAAISAAANDQTRLLLPAGDLLFDEDLVLPSGFIGCGSMVGLGRKVTRLVPQGGCNGVIIDLSAQKPANNTWDLADFGIVAPVPVQGGAVAAGIGLKISYGLAGLGSIENQPGSSVRRVAIYGGGWTFGAIFQECWHALLEDFYCYGSQSTYTKASQLGKGDGGAGSGVGVQFMSGVNNHVKGAFEVEFFSQGLTTNANGRGAGGDCQGLFIDDLSMVECIEGGHFYGTPGGNLSTIVISSWMIDNGNLDVPNHRGFVFDNAEDCEIGEGQSLQDGGDSHIIFNTCKDCSISEDVVSRTARTRPGHRFRTTTARTTTWGQSASKPPQHLGARQGRHRRRHPDCGLCDWRDRASGGLDSGDGPGLAQFGVSGVLPDPVLKLFSGATLTLQNAGWGGSTQIAAAAAKVGAFNWAPGSNDSAILTTLRSDLTPRRCQERPATLGMPWSKCTRFPGRKSA